MAFLQIPPLKFPLHELIDGVARPFRPSLSGC
jgi:hypothetical protein